MKKTIWTAAALIPALALAAAPAHATVVAITYSGVVASGVDGTGVFGRAGTDLSGSNFETRYLIDTDRVPVTHLSFGQNNNTLTGGTSSGTDDPVITATLTINGLSYVLDGRTYSNIYNTSTPNYSIQYSEATVSEGSPAQSENSRFMNTAFAGDSRYPLSLEGPFSGAITGPSDGSFRIDRQVYASGTTYAASGVLLNQYLSIAVVPAVTAVPEPAGWTVMILSLGLVGVATRRSGAARTDRRAQA